jgi:hypothetical protein
LSKATLYATLTQLKRFFQWLAWQPGTNPDFKEFAGLSARLSLPDNDIG